MKAPQRSTRGLTATITELSLQRRAQEVEEDKLALAQRQRDLLERLESVAEENLALQSQMDTQVRRTFCHAGLLAREQSTTRAPFCHGRMQSQGLSSFLAVVGCTALRSYRVTRARDCIC